MDGNHLAYGLHVPGTAVSAPSYEQLPAYRDTPRPRRRLRADEHELRPEPERREMIDGEILHTFPAELDHAVQNGDLDYLLRAHLVPRYRVATDLVTRHDPGRFRRAPRRCSSRSRPPHPSLAEPMPIGAILDAASVDDTVARALDARRIR